MKLTDLDPQWLIKEHFFGIYKTDPITGKVYLVDPQDSTNRFPEEVLQRAIDSAIDRLEGHLNAKIRPVMQIEELQDFDKDLFNDYIYIRLRQYPLATIHSLQIVYGENGETVWDIPQDIIQRKIDDFGIIQVLPWRGVAVGEQFDPALVPFITGTVAAHYAPNVLKIVYDAGMSGDLDWDILRAIGLLASMHPFNILGDVVIGAGIASISTSFDGISQSVNTTASAENSAYSSRIIQYRKELYGEQNTPGLINTLQAKWRRMPLGRL